MGWPIIPHSTLDNVLKSTYLHLSLTYANINFNYLNDLQLVSLI
jgi:hypothetical protein